MTKFGKFSIVTMLLSKSIFHMKLLSPFDIFFHSDSRSSPESLISFSFISSIPLIWDMSVRNHILCFGTFSFLLKVILKCFVLSLILRTWFLCGFIFSILFFVLLLEERGGSLSSCICFQLPRLCPHQPLNTYLLLGILRYSRHILLECSVFQSWKKLSP